MSITHLDYLTLARRIEELEVKVKTLSYYVDKQPQEEHAVKSTAQTTLNFTHPAGAAGSLGLDREIIKELLEILEHRTGSGNGCFFQNLSPEDRNKPMGISCPCDKCSPYSMGD